MPRNSGVPTAVYRRLQRHLDAQAVGFPSSFTGADLRLLRRLFSPEEAGLALFLSFRPQTGAAIGVRAAGAYAESEVLLHLEGMFVKGAIGRRERGGEVFWNLLPMVVGMYEGQDGDPSLDFLEDADGYMQGLGFARALLNTDPPQMRTIPVNRSIEVEPNRVPTFHQVRGIVADAPGPFVVIPCICRERKALAGKACRKTERKETCLGFNEAAAMVLRRGHGREVTREEVLEILEESQREGLVLQPANTRKPEFICSCCGCCCGMLGMQKMLPHPTDFWARSFIARVEEGVCTGCGRCVDRCQVGAIAVSAEAGVAQVSLNRCIGCGLCVPTCVSEAVHLEAMEESPLPPADEDALYETIYTNRRGIWGQLRMLLGIAFGFLRK